MTRFAAVCMVLGLFLVPSLCPADEAWDDFVKAKEQAEKPTLTAKGQAKPKLISKDIIISKIKQRESVEFSSDSVLFEYGRAAVRPDYLPQLRVIAESLKDPQVAHVSHFYVDGHTCNIGTDPNNCRLSWERARAIVDYLVESGMERSKLIPRGFGEGSPKYSNDMEEDRRLNRRVVLLGRDAAERYASRGGADSFEAGESRVCREWTPPDHDPGPPDRVSPGPPDRGDPGPPERSSGGGSAGNLDSLIRRAENGDAAAQCALGDIYFYGRGVPQDYAEAHKWYSSAVEQEVTCGSSKGFLAAKEAFLKRKGQGSLPGFKKRTVPSSAPESREKGFSPGPGTR